MHAGKLTSAAIAASLLLFTNLSTNINSAHADKKADADSEPAAKTATRTETKTAARTTNKAATASPAKATTSTKGKATTTSADPVVTSDVKAEANAKVTADDLAIINVDEDVAWFDQPIIAPSKKSAPATTKAKAPEKKQAPRYGVAIGLGSRSAGNEPVVVEEREVRGRFNRNVVVSVLRDNEASVGYCRAKARRAGETATQMVLSFKVDKRGKQSGVVVTDTAGKKAVKMSRCIAKRMKSWKFPAQSAGGSIEYPLMVQEVGPATHK